MLGDRVTILAIIAVVFGLAAVAWGAWTLHQQLGRDAVPANQQSNEANTQESAAGRDGGVASSSPSQVLQPPTEHEKESEPAADDSEGVHQRRWYPQAPKFTSNFWIALFTAGLFAVAVVQGLTISSQANIMDETLSQMKRDSASQVKQFKDQLAVVEKQAAAAERASFANRAWLSMQYLGMSEPDETEIRALGRRAVVSIQILIKNHGLTPARIDKGLEASLYVVDSEGSSEATDPWITKIDPDNSEHDKYITREPSQVWERESSRTIMGRSNATGSAGGEIKQELTILGNGGSNPIVIEFVFDPPGHFFDYDPSLGAPRFDYWIHVEVPYLDVYQVERRTCFFAHIDGQDALLADHIASERHNYQR